MKLWIISDLHVDIRDNPKTLEQFLDGRPVPEHDLCLIAGDIREDCAKATRWVSAQGFPTDVRTIAGNHEFYGENVDTNRNKASALDPKVRLMENEWEDFGDVRLFAATLWTDFALYSNNGLETSKACLAAERGMNDFRKIRVAAAGYRRLMPEDTIQFHRRSLIALENAKASLGDKKLVVMTHHAPLETSVDSRYGKDALNPAFASHLPEHVKGVSLWIHGHTHHPFDYDYAGTRIICNPSGYRRHGEGKDFIPDLVVEV